MPNIQIKIDTAALADLGDKFEQAAKAGLIRTLELGEQYLRQEAPERTGLLRGKKGNNSISSDYRQTATGYEGEFIVSAIRERRGARKAAYRMSCHHRPGSRTGNRPRKRRRRSVARSPRRGTSFHHPWSARCSTAWAGLYRPSAMSAAAQRTNCWIVLTSSPGCCAAMLLQ